MTGVVAKIHQKSPSKLYLLQTAGKKYDYIDSLDSGLIKKVGLVVRNKLQKANVPVSVSDKNTIGFQLDQYGNNRRNLRVLAKKV